MPLTTKKASYTPLNPWHEEDVPPCSDPSHLHHDHLQLTWKRRFYILLVSSFSALAVLLLGGTSFYHSLLSQQHQEYQQQQQLPPPCLAPYTATGPGTEVKIPYSPAPVRYVNRFFSDDPDTHKFMGKPRKELDEAWHNLLTATALHFSAEEMQQAGNATSVLHKDGGYIGGLGLSHSLHCLKRIKQYIHPEYYYSQQDQDWETIYTHLDHCLESLRQSTLCMADVSIYTFKWTPQSKTRPVVDVPQPHACIDWEALHEWMLAREATVDDLVGPPDEMSV